MKTTKAIKIWTEDYSPFIMGGDVFQPIATRVIPESSFTINKIKLHVIRNQKTGQYHIAESVTGAFVGHGKTAKDAIGQVTRDLASADPAIVRQQIAHAKERVKETRELSPEKFWERFR